MPDYDAKTALLVVDVQNDFADPKGALYVRGGEEIISRINAEIADAKAAEAIVVYTQDWHPDTTPHFQKNGGVWPVHCVHDSWGAAFHPQLVVEPHAVIHKGSGGEDGYSAFSVRDPRSGESSPTVLGELLRRHGIERVVIVGLATDYCVKETALDARGLGFAAFAVEDAIRAVDLNPGDGDRALAAIRAAGASIL